MQKGRNQREQNGDRRLSDSQNFITDGRLINRIVNLSNICKKDKVIEIGTGKGHLTDALCKKSGSVCSVEIDRRLCEREKGCRVYLILSLCAGIFSNTVFLRKGITRYLPISLISLRRRSLKS